MNRVAKQYVLPYLWITLASAVYAVGFNWCYEPNQIGFGGITGVGQIINHILPWAPIGTVVIILNIPLFLLGWKLLGGHLLVSSLYSMFISSIFIDILHMIHTFEPMEPILGCIFGGVIMGGSLGVVFLQGATTGGTDLIARLLKLKLAWLPMGRLLLAGGLLYVAGGGGVWRQAAQEDRQLRLGQRHAAGHCADGQDRGAGHREHHGRQHHGRLCRRQPH